MKNIYSILFFTLTITSISAAETPWPPINPKGKPIPFNWSVNDGAGYVWDITAYGSVNDGTNDAYDGGMIIQVNGNQFTATNGKGTLTESGREVMIGPWTNKKIQVYRFVYIDPDVGSFKRRGDARPVLAEVFRDGHFRAGGLDISAP